MAEIHLEAYSTNYGFIIYTQVRMTKLLVMLSVQYSYFCSLRSKEGFRY